MATATTLRLTWDAVTRTWASDAPYLRIAEHDLALWVRIVGPRWARIVFNDQE